MKVTLSQARRHLLYVRIIGGVRRFLYGWLQWSSLSRRPIDQAYLNVKWTEWKRRAQSHGYWQSRVTAQEWQKVLNAQEAPK